MNIKSLFASISSAINSFQKWRHLLGEYRYLKNLFKNVETKHFFKKTIVFNTVKCVRDHIDREFFIGKLLALNGAKVYMLLDNGLLKHWEKGPKKNYSYYFRNYKNPFYLFFFRYLMRKALKTYTDKNLQIIYYSDILRNVDQKNWKNLKKFAISSTIRFFQTSELDYNDSRVKDYYELSLKNALLSRNIGEYVLKKIQPNYFVTSHGIYSTWGPAFEFLKENNINCIVCARFHTHTLEAQNFYFTTSKTQTLSRCDFWQKYKDTPVTKYMINKVEKLINQRINHSTEDTISYYSERIGLYQINKDDHYKHHIAIFPSLIWDGNIKDRHIAFTGILDWITSTIDFLKERKDIRIYLKFHPAEVTIFQNSAKIEDLIKDYLEQNRIENLVLIPTRTNIDPYKFIKSGVDFGICYDGIIALEMAHLKIPVLLGGGGGRFCVEGGNFQAKSREEYFNYLDKIDEIIEDYKINYNKYYENIVRYAYWYFFANVLTLPTLSKKNRRKIDLYQVKKKDLILDKKYFEIFSN